MGKATRRRKQRRQQYLGRLARQAPAKFHSEWSKRLESWAKEARRRAGQLTGEDGGPVPAAFALVETALEELIGCGPEAVNLEYESSKETMLDACCRAVAGAVDPRMYRLTNARPKYCQMDAGTQNSAS